MTSDPQATLLRAKARYDRVFEKTNAERQQAREALKAAVVSAEPVKKAHVAEWFGWSRQSVYDLLGEE